MADQNLLLILGNIGNLLLFFSYFPQIKKLIKTKKSDDISVLTWVTIIAGDILLLLYAILTADIVFTILFILFSVENIIVLILTLKYRTRHENLS